MDQAAQRGDMTLLDRSLTDIQDKFGSTTLAHQAALLAGRCRGEFTATVELLFHLAQVSFGDNDSQARQVVVPFVSGIHAVEFAFEVLVHDLPERLQLDADRPRGDFRSSRIGDSL